MASPARKGDANEPAHTTSSPAAGGGPFNHLPDSLALSLKVLKRYKREGRTLSAEEAEILAGIADVVREFEIMSGDGKASATTTTPAVTSAGNSVVSSRLNAALSHAHRSAASEVQAVGNNDSIAAGHQQPNPTIYTTSSASAAGGGGGTSKHNVSTTSAQHLSPRSNPLSTHIGAANNNANANVSSHPSSPSSQSLLGVIPPPTPGGGGEAVRIKDLIAKLRRAADSGEVFKELMHKSATVDSLVEFAVQCNKASNSRFALASVIVTGVRAMAGRAPEPKSRPISASLNSSSHHPSAANDQSPSRGQTPHQTSARHHPQHHQGSSSGNNPSPYYLYGKHNMRLFLLNKNNEVLEDPLTGEMIGGISAACGVDTSTSIANKANKNYSSSTTASADPQTSSPRGDDGETTARNATTIGVSIAALGGGADNVSTSSSIPPPAVYVPPTTLGALAMANNTSQSASAEHSYTLLSPKRVESSTPTIVGAAVPPSPPLAVVPAPTILSAEESNAPAGDPAAANNAVTTDMITTSSSGLATTNTDLVVPTASYSREDADSLAVIVRAITDCFLGGASNENIERGGHLFLPMTVDGECLGVLAIFEYKSTIDTQNKMPIVAASQSIAALSIRNVGLLEDVGWQMGKANAMLEMANQLAFDNLDERTLSQSIITTAKTLIEADRCSIFVVKGDTLQAYFEDGQTVIISNKSGIAGHVARTGETVNIPEAYEDERFNPSVDKATGYRTKTILCMPIRFGDQIVGVAQLINKKPLVVNSELRDEGSDKPSIARWQVERTFSSRDEELFGTFSTFVGVSLRNCRINQGLQTETEKSKAILDVVAMLSQTDIRDVNNIAAHVMAGAKRLLHADRSTLFLVDKENHELYSNELADKNTTGSELRIPFGRGVAGKVASTQHAENIVDAYSNPDFDPTVDKLLGYTTYSMLCEPIVYHNEVLAVAQLMNKIDHAAMAYEASVGGSDHQSRPIFTAFTEKDQETFRTFAMFAGISISNAHMLRFAVDAGNELVALNARIDGRGDVFSMESSMSIPDGSINIPPSIKRRNAEVQKKKISSKDRQGVLDALAILNSYPEFDVTSPSFDLFAVRSRAENPSDMGCAVVLKVFQQTGFLDLFNVDTEVFLNFLCECRRLYRKVPYHNFFHVVDACQTIYTFLFRGGIREQLSDWECFTLLITAIVHDLDHMGVNNSFHLKTDSPLGILSSATGNTSVLEVHHCNLAIDILADPTANVFAGMDEKTRSLAVRSLIECVLATDMARHGEFMAKMEALTAGGPIGSPDGLNMSDIAHRKLVMDLVMKAADISNVTKPFELSRLWAVAVTEEFYRQGDQERAKGVEVLPQFDRNKKTELAKGQIGFINFVCEKFFAVISSDNAFPKLRWTLENLQKNKQEWTAVLNGTTRRPSLIDLTHVVTPSPQNAISGSPRPQSVRKDVAAAPPSQQQSLPPIPPPSSSSPPPPPPVGDVSSTSSSAK